ncbi:hypothetical protein B0H15DRAFT_802268 [Mycena belliarum]|uniref:Uncharacterized protein n=1 Tax=Mycena belliarum TaxID=1033014 RepID=A0AAD6XSW9_9AGAR|nr:hypothetical protein B0H15DRAFT_802268 [Mycena belliae]
MTSTPNLDLPFDFPPSPAASKENFFDTASLVSHKATQSLTEFRGKRILALGLGILLSIVLLLVGLFIHIFVTHETVNQGLHVFTTAPLGSTLTLVHVLSVLLILTLPLVVRLEGYRLAWAWLDASADSGPNRPTPFQLGIIMKILNGGNLVALRGGFSHMRGLSPKKRNSYKAPLLRSATVVLAFGIAATYGFVVLDIIFSILSTTASFSQLTDYRATWPQLSRQINSSTCARTFGAVAPGMNLCGLQSTGVAPFSASLPQALRTLNNNSATNSVAFGDDGTAFIVPSSIPDSLTFSASSYGVASVCQSITPQCVGPGPSYGPAQYLALSCPASAGFNATLNMTSSAYPFGILDASGNEYASPYLVNTNPFQFGAVVASEAYTSGPNTFVGSTGFFTHGNLGAYNVLTCSVTVRSVAYTYFNGSFTVDAANSSTVTDLDITRIVAAMSTAADLSARIPAAIDGADADYTAAFARELSRELIAFTSALYVPGPAQDVQAASPVLGARLPLLPLALLGALAAVYSAFVLFLTVGAVRAISASPYTMLARARLADPLTAVHAAYARGEPHRTWESAGPRLFSAETGLDRLTVGPMSSPAGGLAFGVSRTVVVPAQT